MIATSNHGSALWHILPAVTAAFAVVLDAVPLPHTGPTATFPLITLCVMFFWLVHRPHLMNPPIIFAGTIALDAWTQMPLGLSALAFLSARALLMPKDRFLATSPFLVVWACFALAAACVLGMRWLLASFWWDRLLSGGPALLEWSVTVLFYPIVAHPLAACHRLMPKVRHASGS